MKTNELRALIQQNLEALKVAKGLNEVAFQLVNNENMFPHVVFDFDGVGALNDDLNRRDVKVLFDIYDRGSSAVFVNDVADALEDIFDAKNLPQANNLPTFFFDTRRDLRDEDKMIRHIQLRFIVQIYERN